jgi:parallel beta-helix repeat protein
MKTAIRIVVTASTVLIIALSIMISNFQHADALDPIILVPTDYPTISAAIEHASQGATIFVEAGKYYENPTIDKSLTILGSLQNTIVVGEGGLERGARPVFTVISDNVKISGFTIRSQVYSNSTLYASAINLHGDNCTITDNNIQGTYYGIYISAQSGTNISENVINGTHKDGIRICGGSQNTIISNTITGNAQSGIAIDGYSDLVASNNITNNNRAIGLGASYSVVFQNNLAENTESGIWLASSNSIIAANNITQTTYGVYCSPFFSPPVDNKFYHNNFIGNECNVYFSSNGNLERWDNNKEGNYWATSSVIDENGDGISEASFSINVDNVDEHPLAEAFKSKLDSVPPEMPSLPSNANTVAALWHLDEVSQNGASPDAEGNNPLVLRPNKKGGYDPILVEGRFGQALQFNGTDYACATVSPSLEIDGEVTIDAWIKVTQFKEVSYNNIAVECLRTPDRFATRVLGFAINGLQPVSSDSLAQGALRGFFLDKAGEFNEIITSNFAVQLNEWLHVAFVRSSTTGMHIYVNGEEEPTVVVSGMQNPTEPIARGTEYYVGHDSFCTIDEVIVYSSATIPNNQTQNQTPIVTPTSAQSQQGNKSLDSMSPLLLGVLATSIISAAVVGSILFRKSKRAN